MVAGQPALHEAPSPCFASCLSQITSVDPRAYARVCPSGGRVLIDQIESWLNRRRAGAGASSLGVLLGPGAAGAVYVR